MAHVSKYNIYFKNIKNTTLADTFLTSCTGALLVHSQTQICKQPALSLMKSF